MTEEIIALAKRWRKEADAYQKMVEEAQSKGLPHDQMLSMMTALRACAKDLESQFQEKTEYQEWWMNVYPGQILRCHDSKEEADLKCGFSRIDCIHVRKI